MNEINLRYELKLANDGSHDQGISLKFNKPGTVTHNIVSSPDDKRFFQRIKILDNGFIVAEEVWRDFRIMRFSHPFRQEGDTLFFEV